MSTPQVHTFGIAKYVYASAYDKLEADNAALRETLREAEALIDHYFHETPLGNQPHMIAHKAEAWLKAREARQGGTT